VGRGNIEALPPPAPTETDRPPPRAVSLVHPLAAVIVALIACQVAFRGVVAIDTTGGAAETERLLRLILDRR
jgi:hypothetical protein